MGLKSFNIDWVREQFPALENKMVFMDNAGGSQTLKPVMDRITEYLTHYDVQLGASYQTSQVASDQLELSKRAVQNWVNAKHPDEVMIGSSTTMLLRILSICISRDWKEGDEVIITNSDHESNMAPWKDLERAGITVKTWKVNKDSYRFELDDLNTLMTENTKLVALTHTSNILGTINPIKDIAKLVHKNNALICVDGVAFAPHRLIDVQDLDVDFYVFSTYKTFGPHQAVMYGRLEQWNNMQGINHAFIESVPYKFQPGNVNYELSYSLAAIPQYIAKIGDDNLAHGFEKIADYEQELASRLLDYLKSNPKVTIIGETSADKNLRVSTLSFIHSDLNSHEIVEKVDTHDIGIRFGDFYAVELIDDLDLRQYNGVVRVSLVHYNSFDEVDKLINVFQGILD
jgi:cysteine desulfurase family protein (TIGR01976 family)